MINKFAFLEEEIPYCQLNKLGLTKNQILSFPKEVLTPFLNGRTTPLIVIPYKDIWLPMKMQLTRNNKNEINAIIYPVRKTIANHPDINFYDLEEIKKGKTIRKEIKEDGKRILKYYQLDNEVNSIISKSSLDLKIKDRMNEVETINDIQLGLNQKKQLTEGKPLSLSLENTRVVVGIDLREPTGFKMLKGDMKEWEEQRKIKYDLEHPEIKGYVKTDANRWEYYQFISSQEKQQTKNSIKY